MKGLRFYMGVGFRVLEGDLVRGLWVLKGSGFYGSRVQEFKGFGVSGLKV